MRAVLVGVLALGLVASSAAAQGSYHRKGYVTKSGTHVPPSRATKPDRSVTNNWSSKPNVNPYTGKAGTKDPYAPKKAKSAW